MSVSEAVGAGLVWRDEHPATLLEAIASLRTSSSPTPGDPTAAIRDLNLAIADGSDQLAAIAAVHALAACSGVEPGERLAALLYQEVSFLRKHAAWALGSRSPVTTALPGLVDLVLDGGFAGTLAQATLESFAAENPGLVRDALVAAVPYATLEGSRGRLVETLGLVPGVVTTRILLELAADDRELPAARAAALAALGDHADPSDSQVHAVLDAVAGSHSLLAGVAGLACSDLDHRRSPLVGRARRQGLAVAQLFLHADIDGDLRRAGQGDTGGIATLLVHLGDALLDSPGPVRRVVTISRGRTGDDPGLESVDRPGHHYLPVPFWEAPVPAAEAWPLRVATRRAVRRILDRAQVDVLHLRMADVGSWAAAEAAHDLGVPVVLTLAPDPHASVAAREANGVLTRENVGRVDEVEHLAFRIDLLRRIRQQAAQLVVFPRPALAANLRDLLGVDLEREQDRVTVVPEGIDPVPLDRAAREVPAAARGEYAPAATLDALDDLDDLLLTLPPERRGLPLAVSVGRLHPVKGMATLVEAWAGHPELAERCNLVVVGGDLQHPNPDEREQLSRIDAAVARVDGPGVGLLLAGHRPNATVATWLAAVRVGRPDLCAPGGVYVSASLKEEFGIAILEAMASGLVVVAPWEGGPATYVEDGVTGVLADTRTPAALAAAVVAAFDLADAPGAGRRAAGAQRLVRERFSVHTMAAALAGIYQDVAP